MTLVSTASRAASGTGAMTLLGSQVLSGTQATFDTNTILPGNISNAYNHLRVVLLARDNSAGTGNNGVNCQFNGDTAANYDFNYMYGSNAVMSVASSTATTSLLIGTCVNGGATAAQFAQSVADIVGYTQATGNKVVTVTGYGRADATVTGQRTWEIGNTWRSSAAITRMVLTPATGSFAAGSAFYLYGVL